MFQEFIFLAARTGDFGQDIIIPAIIAGIVLTMIANSLLNHFGWTLW